MVEQKHSHPKLNPLVRHTTLPQIVSPLALVKARVFQLLDTQREILFEYESFQTVAPM